MFGALWRWFWWSAGGQSGVAPVTIPRICIPGIDRSRVTLAGSDRSRVTVVGTDRSHVTIPGGIAEC